MLFEIIILVLTTIVGYYLYAYKRIHTHFKQRGVKFIPGVPLFGNVLGLTFLKKHFFDELDDVYNAFPNERYVGFLEFTLPVILVRDPELIKTIVVKDFDHFTDHREILSEELDPLFAGSLLLMKGEKWHDMRTTLSPAFTSSKMKYILPLMSDITNNIVEYLYEQQGQDIDVDDLMRRYTTDVIASAAFGLQVNSLKDRDNQFHKMGNELFDLTIRQRLLFILVTQFPQFGKKLGIRIFSDRAYDFFSNIVATSMEYRKREKIERPDMIQLLMEAKREWTPEEITSQAFIFFFAGFETSASALVMAIHELALNPDIQDKLYQECRKYKEHRVLAFENLTEMKYLDAVINGILRKWSPAIILDRTCTKAYELPPPRQGGKPYLVKPGDILYNSVNSIHMDPKYWADPHKFDPDRFLEENKVKIKPFTFTPFGGGPRACIGVRFAMMMLKVLLFNIILNLKIIKTSKTSEIIKLKPHNFNIRAVNGTFVRFEKRILE
ncbi:unnamed protein product [Arctia plantaginis]|uniref:unspecific monooxygenase n=1 Tax=Arctia plantaginis TaxID=874455 RepID=A0A8S1B547_ARCPL|nr:unnamed protein product [Arctia plantaginis]